MDDIRLILAGIQILAVKIEEYLCVVSQTVVTQKILGLEVCELGIGIVIQSVLSPEVRYTACRGYSGSSEEYYGAAVFEYLVHPRYTLFKRSVLS